MTRGRICRVAGGVAGVAVAALVWGLHKKPDWIPNSRLRSSLDRVQPADIDCIDLKGLYMALPDSANPGEETALGNPQVITDKTTIATFLRVFRASRHRATATEGGDSENSSDEITFEVHGKPYGIVVPIDGVLIGNDYGPEVEALYEKYRQRPWFPWDAARKREIEAARKRSP